MTEFVQKIFDSDFMPHGHCYYWMPEIVWLHVISDALITLAYYSIPLILLYFVRKRKDLAFNWMFLMFGAFIFACGTTHLLEIWSIWHGTYRLSGIVKLVTAGLSMVTAVLLVPLVPKALALQSPAQLEAINRKLEKAIAERKSTEEQVASLNQVLAMRASKLEVANKELEAFSYSISHDLRTPLRAISGFSRMLIQEHSQSLDQEGQRLLTVVSDSVKQMGLLIDDLLSFSRLGRQALERSDVDMGRLVKSVVEELQKNEMDRRLSVHIDEMPVTTGDEAMLRQVWINLISNAIKFTRKASLAQIEIGSMSADHNGHAQGGPVYFIKDNGVGFDMQHANKLFGVFQRLHKAEDYEGTGVGLAIVQRVVQHHGGKIWAESMKDRGAAFYFTLKGDCL